MIPKKGDKQLIKNYMPISLLPICGRILENIIFNPHYCQHASYRNSIGFSFRWFHNKPIIIYCRWNPPSSVYFQVRAVFFDISKAFNKVWLMDLSLNWSKIPGGLLKLFQFFLSNRKQCVVLNCPYSDYSSIESGVPRGSVLDPLLFLNYAKVKDTEISAIHLNHYIDTISQ